MKLDRNITNPRRGKYALIKLRLRDAPIILEPTADVAGGKGAKYLPVLAEAVDFGDSEDSDFFVIRLKDKYAGPALAAYAGAAMMDDPEYGREIMRLFQIALAHPRKRIPD